MVLLVSRRLFTDASAHVCMPLVPLLIAEHLDSTAGPVTISSATKHWM